MYVIHVHVCYQHIMSWNIKFDTFELDVQKALLERWFGYGVVFYVKVMYPYPHALFPACSMLFCVQHCRAEKFVPEDNKRRFFSDNLTVR